jgi:hypothetical protein
VRTGILLVACAAASCARAADAIAIAWSIEPAPATGAETVAGFTLEDEAGRPVRGARLRMDAHMSHPGMAPVTTTVTELGDGRYQGRIRFSMAGDWVLVVTGELPDGTRFTRQLEVAGVRPAG